MAYSNGMFGSPSTETALPSSTNSTVATGASPQPERLSAVRPQASRAYVPDCRQGSHIPPWPIKNPQETAAGAGRLAGPLRVALYPRPRNAAQSHSQRFAVFRKARALHSHDAEALASGSLHDHPALEPIHDFRAELL